MKLALLLYVGASLLVGPAYADDHLFQATQSGGLSVNPVTGVITNKAGHVVPDHAPGQGSPFAGNDQCTPATANEVARAHANVKPKGADSIADCFE
ncbi:MAG: hypothetical protein JWQ89_1226 [Devosia sp.]|uniref:hypothetical protein n=1 Tax=Devosia sp. TaxID=1871048 RepID=UPI00262C5A74|nr:hypothetical protein [Devosia sp.]MDB5539499.1 hypothetical protein [Devosia sp.]